MSVKAEFPAGVEAITVHGLHQWDYGQKLEIVFNPGEVPLIGEIHFFHPGMKEAVVRVCEFNPDGTEVVIPDICLEQTAPVTACIFAIDGTTGTTLKKLTMPVNPRMRPSALPDTLVKFPDKHQEIITVVNKLNKTFKEGFNASTLEVPFAERCSEADEAEYCPYTADEADEADLARYADVSEGDYTAKGTIAERLGALEDYSFNGRVAEAGHAAQTDSLAPGFTVLTRKAGHYYLPLSVEDIQRDQRLYVVMFTTSTGTGLNLDFVVPYMVDELGTIWKSARGPGCRTGDYAEIVSGFNYFEFHKSNGSLYNPKDVYYRVL